LPLYEYVCANGHRTEVMHGIHDSGPATCPVCGAAMRKAFVAPTIHFKGSGWAKVDRRSSSGSKKSSGESTGSDTSTGEAAKSDSTTTASTTTTDSASHKTAPSSSD